MHCSTTRVVSLKTRHPISVDERAEGETVPCAAPANVCICWMAAWFALAERVGEERQAGANRD
jgi:hypothetical protein